jgi:hypothetical protein
MRHMLPILFILLAAPSGASTQVAVLEPVRDNSLFQDADGDTSNGIGPALFAGNNGQNLTRRALLQFDVAGRVPASSTIDSVVLTLQVSNAPNAIPRQFTLHRVLSDWGEGTSYATGGAGASATPGDATWLYAFFPGSAWSVPGGDFAAAASASRLVTGVGIYTWTSAGMTADARSWLTQPGANFGWLIQGDEEQPGTARRFDSRESDTPGSRPTLTIYYSGATASLSQSWGSLKARYR